jgi:hypothetical protein
MIRSQQEGTRIVRAWLDEGTTELSIRVRDGVLRDFPAITQEGPHWASRGTWRRTNAVVLAGAAVVVVLLVSAANQLVPGTGPAGAGPTVGSSSSPTMAPSPSQTSRWSPAPDRSYRQVGYIGLPPPDATPSSNLTTQLIDWWALPTSYDGVNDSSGPGYLGSARMYADGRLIWNEYYAGVSSSTGWLEQRLSSEGLELVPTFALTDPPNEFKRLDYIRLPERLPASAWVDPTVRPYVASGFAACVHVVNLGNGVLDESLTLDELLDRLPSAAAELLRDRPSVEGLYDDPSSHCLGMTTADARRLDAALDNAGLAQDEGRNRYLLEYHIDLDGDGPEARWLNVWFEPIMPDGTVTCSSCG